MEGREDDVLIKPLRYTGWNLAHTMRLDDLVRTYELLKQGNRTGRH